VLPAGIRHITADNEVDEPMIFNLQEIEIGMVPDAVDFYDP
jgi:hypothetical protein